LLAANAAKSAREQLTLIRMFEELRGRGYDGGYDAVRRYTRRWRQERGQSTAAAYVRLSFAPVEAYQLDWSHEVVLLEPTYRRIANAIEADVGSRYSGFPPAASAETAASMADMPPTEGKASGATPCPARMSRGSR
jgi:hypothetical protein